MKPISLKDQNKESYKALCAYLPYDLKVIGNNGEYREMNGLSEYKGEILIHTCFTEMNPDSHSDTVKRYRKCSLYSNSKINFKPILRPLSDLTEEITHNNEMFTPLLRLANNNYYIIKKLTMPFNRVKYINDANMLAYRDGVEISQYQCRFYRFDKNGDMNNISFEFYSDKSSMSRKHYADLENYNLLLQWHFDVFGLIDKDMAIDINTLES